jgi:prolyl-tRNA synthetase
VIVELFADDKGLVWPDNVSPAKVYLARLQDTEEVIKAADGLYERLQSAGASVLYDDRDLRAGEKFADADLMGIPHRLVVSTKTVQAGRHELKQRTSADSDELTPDEIIQKLTSSHTRTLAK